MKTTLFCIRFGLLFLFGGSFAVIGQVAPQAQSESQNIIAAPVAKKQTTLQAFQTEQGALAAQALTLEANGATSKQLKAWHQQNASAIALQQQRAQTLTLSSTKLVESTNLQPNIPPGTSEALKSFLIQRAALANARARIHNQLVTQAIASGKSPTVAQLVTLQRQEQKLFKAQNASALKAQEQTAKNLSQQSAQTTQRLPALIIPANATPQQAAFITQRNEMIRGLVQLRNANASATPQAKMAAERAWYKANAGRLNQVREQSEVLSQATTTD